MDFSSLQGKTRENNAIYTEIEAKRAQVEDAASKLDQLADAFAMMGQVNLAEQKRAEAAKVRSTGLDALNNLETVIRIVYSKGDEAIAEAGTKADEARQVVSYLPSLVSTVRTINRQKWEFIDKELVKESITADEYKALDAAVIAAYDSGEEIAEHDDVELLDELFASSTVIQALVDQYSVQVTVKANVVAKNAVDTASTVVLDVYNKDFPLDKTPPPPTFWLPLTPVAWRTPLWLPGTATTMWARPITTV